VDDSAEHVRGACDCRRADGNGRTGRGHDRKCFDGGKPGRRVLDGRGQYDRDVHVRQHAVRVEKEYRVGAGRTAAFSRRRKYRGRGVGRRVEVQSLR
jgi:hypothetical protein